jgi:hypothetical protein
MFKTIKIPSFSLFFGIFLFIIIFISFPHSNNEIAGLFPSFTDYFLFSKSITLLIFDIFIIIYIFLKKQKISETVQHQDLVLLFISAVFTCLSGFFSAHREYAFLGLPTEYEGVLNYLSYFLVFIACTMFLNDKQLRTIITILSVFVILATAFDFFIKPLSEILYNISPSHGIFLLTGNTAVYGVLCLFLMLMNGNNLLINVGLLFCIVLSDSTVSFYLAIFYLVYKFIKHFKIRKVLAKIKKKFYVIPILTLLILGIFFDYALSDSKFFSHIIVNITNYGAYNNKYNSQFDLKSVEIVGNKIVFKGENNTVYVDNNGNVEGIGVDTTVKDNVIFVHLGYSTLYFTTDNPPEYLYNGYKSKISPEKTAKYDKFYSFATGRGYIWLNTLPMLKDCVIMGKGAGSYAFNFPHTDIVGQLKTHGVAYLFTDKPHSFFLQFWFNNGLIAFICLMLFFFRHRSVEMLVAFVALTINDGSAPFMILLFAMISRRSSYE